MSSPSASELPHQVQELLSNGPVIRAMSYMSAVALTVILWDHAVAFTDEVNFMWCRPFTFGKFLYFTVRYLGASAQIMTARGELSATLGVALLTAPRLSHKWDTDRNWANRRLVRSFISCLKDRRRLYPGDIKLPLRWVLTAVASVSFAIPSVMALFKTIVADNTFFHICLTPTKPKIWAGIWAPQLIFAIFIASMTIINASSRPRRMNMKITAELLRMGAFQYLIYCVLRLLSFVFAMFNNPAYILLVFL
ncbi:hypothetical protein OF83DRAFT_1179042 [Amylostereum chailletii]|nr:hypothetical protein OF83DRAFT_1179042 [Amylostereum chailletii]